MDTVSNWEWVRQRVGNRIGRGLFLMSWVTPAPIWISEGDAWQARWHWYGLAISYPRRPSASQLASVPPWLRPWIGFADDMQAAWTPGDVDRAVGQLLGSFGSAPTINGGALVGPPFWGADP